MNNLAQTELRTATTAAEATDDIEARLAEIAAALAARTADAPESAAVATSRALSDGMACPIDPAERAACEACQ